MGNIEMEIGIKRTDDGGVFCESCGNDLSDASAAKFVAHLDGKKFFEYQFSCVKCGEAIIQRFKRSKEDAAWWR